MKHINRRIFAKTLAHSLFVGGTALYILTCSKDKSTEPKDNKTTFELSLADTPELGAIGGATSLVAGGIPVTIFRLSADGFVTFSRICTYESCAIEWDVDEEKFVCPCNACTFDRNGNVLSGPATRRLTTYDTTFNVQENVVVIRF